MKINLYSCDLEALELPTLEEMAAADDEFLIRKMECADLDELRANFPDELSERKYNILKDRLSEDGKEVFVAVQKSDNAVAGYASASTVDTFVGGIKETLIIPSETAYLFDAYVYNMYRGRKIQGKLLRYRQELYKERGYKKALTCVYDTNDISMKNVLNAGFEYKNSTTRIVPLGINLHPRGGVFDRTG